MQGPLNVKKLNIYETERFSICAASFSPGYILSS